jgi:hypothetical protein
VTNVDMTDTITTPDADEHGLHGIGIRDDRVPEVIRTS